MGRYLLRRVLITIPVLFGVTLVTFLVLNAAPGDAASAFINPELEVLMGEEYVERQRERLGLDQPMPVRYVLWIREITRGNLGYSFSDQRPVSEKVSSRIWPTVYLMLAVQFVALIIAVPIGIFSALRQYSFIDYLATVFAFIAVSIPNFFLALAGIFIFAVTLSLVPTSGMYTIGQEGSILNSLHHLVLPATVLGLSQAAPLIRYIRSSMLEVIRQDYVRSAQAKGLSNRAVVVSHAMRNALIPIITVIALQLPVLFSGTVIIEQIFSWPGMGSLTISAILSRDYPVVMGITLLSGVIVIFFNLVADVLYVIVDPRIKYS